MSLVQVIRKNILKSFVTRLNNKSYSTDGSDYNFLCNRQIEMYHKLWNFHLGYEYFGLSQLTNLSGPVRVKQFF